MHDVDYTRFHVVAGMSTNLTYCRRYGRAPGSQRVGQAVPLHSDPNVTLTAALTPKGLRSIMTISGAVNGDGFAAYFGQVLGPRLRPGDVVVLDNLPARKGDGLAAVVEKCGARLLYLPPHSPVFNPIELAFSKLKTKLRQLRAHTREALEKPCESLPIGFADKTPATGLLTVAAMYIDMRNALVTGVSDRYKSALVCHRGRFFHSANPLTQL